MVHLCPSEDFLVLIFAQAAAITIEAMHSPEILGTIAGDDTVLVITKNEQSALALTEELKVFIV